MVTGVYISRCLFGQLLCPKPWLLPGFRTFRFRFCWSDAPGSYSDAMPDSELKLISRIRKLAGKSSSVVSGIGDDAAVLRMPRGHDVLVTTDFSIRRSALPARLARCERSRLALPDAWAERHCRDGWPSPRRPSCRWRLPATFLRNGWINSSRVCSSWLSNTTFP